MVVGGLLLLCGDRNKSPPEKLWRDEQKLDCHVVQQQQPQLRINVEREMVDIDFFSVVIPLLSPSPATPPLLCLTNGSQHPCHLFTSTHATSSSSYLLERETLIALRPICVPSCATRTKSSRAEKHRCNDTKSYNGQERKTFRTATTSLIMWKSISREKSQ